MTNLKITEENPYFDYESPNEEEYITYNKSVNIDCQKIMNTTAEDILAHLKEGIGTMTWRGEISPVAALRRVRIESPAEL